MARFFYSIIFSKVKPLDILLAVVLSAGAIQGLVYGFILWRNKTANRTANRFLAAILFFFSYRLVVEILKIFGIGFYDLWYHIFLEYNWIYGALIYFFVKAYVTPKFKLSPKKDWIHFLPVGIEFIWSNFIKSQNFFWDGTRESLSWLGYWGYVVWMHYPTMYIICGLLIIFYSFKAEKVLKSTMGVRLTKAKWILNVLRALRIYAVFFIVVVLIDLLFFDYAFNKFYWYPLFIGLALITYVLGILGFSRRNEAIVKSEVLFSDKEQEQLTTIGINMKKLMHDEKVFKDPELTLASLSQKLGVKTYLTTRFLNHIEGKKFNDYINELRIEELKSVLADPKNNKYTLLSLAHEVGFNSKASFNRAVKKITGSSPSDLKSNN